MWKREFSLPQAKVMQILKTIRIIRQMMSLTREQGKTIGFVPTMGALHEGHLSLMRAAKSECDVVVVSIFVNPTQFLVSEDFSGYPRDFEKDRLALEREGVDYLFCPESAEMYRISDMIKLRAPEGLVFVMCGKFRPGHFDGVLQVCAKLFNIIAPHKVYFGQKDYQQALIVKRLISDLDFGIEMKICPTVREVDGLALSSRNVYLKGEDRVRALMLSKLLFKVRDAFKTGERDVKKLLALREGIPAQYFEIRSAEDLSEIDKIEGRAVCALAVLIGDVRLIDNIILDPNELSQG